jgi:hypothetical protein
VQLRFRLATNATVAATGWDIDDIDVSGITNTPFPLLVAEPSTCTAKAAPDGESSMVATFAAPATSLRTHDAAVCILAEVQ